MHTKIWLVWTFLSLIAYSCWGIFNAITIKNTDPYTGIFIASFGFFITGLIALSYIGFKPNINFNSVIPGISIGVATGLGGLFFLNALNSGGKINQVVPITAIYPLLTFILSLVILNEAYSLKQLAGICFSVLAVILLTT